MPGRRDAGAAMLSLAAGTLIALLGWAGGRQLTATSLERLVLGKGKPAAEWTVAVLFRVKECPSRMALIDELNDLTRSRIRVQGLLVVDQAEFRNWRDLVRAYGITFPVRPVTPRQAGTALGSATTPALVVYDPAGRLRLLTDLTDQGLARTLLARILSLSTRSPTGA